MARRVEMVPIEHLTVLNPRTRNRKQHRDIVDNIAEIGLKRPITVRRRASADGAARYEVVCGEGRLDAFRMLGQTLVPVVVVSGSEADCLVMSLVENVARRSHRPIDLIQEIGALRSRGYTDAEIGARIGVTASWVQMIGVLIEKGEERLVAAVESGLVPISFAVDIARAKDGEVQRVLTEAYAEGRIKGKGIGAVRRMLDQRVKRSKSVPDSGFGRNRQRKALTAEELMRLYQREAEKHRILVKKAEFAQDRLLFVVEALRRLLADENFVNVLQAEGLDTLPRSLDDRIAGRAAA
jgi:ParB family chromosome partitioning protein